MIDTPFRSKGFLNFSHTHLRCRSLPTFFFPTFCSLESGGMEEDNKVNAFPFTTSTTLAFGGSSSGNNACYMHEDAGQNHYINLAAGAESNETTPCVPTNLPPWLYYQQTAQNYVEFLAEHGPSQIQKEIQVFSNSPGLAGFSTPEVSFDMVGHQMPYTDGAPPNNLTVLEYQILSQNSNEGNSPAAIGFSSTVPISISKQKAITADRRRRLRISEGLEALQDLLPQSGEGGKASVLDDVIDHIKYLQYQLKELSQSRLGGELSLTPFIRLEGYGHFLLHDQMQNEPLEEMMGKLLEVNPLAATQLLESRGLLTMPMALAEGLRLQN